jgi:hypothetical protein
MAPKYHGTALSGGDRKALKGARSGPCDDDDPRIAVGRYRAKGEALVQTADKLLCES